MEKRIEERWRPGAKNAERGRIWVGLFLLIIGGLFLARESGVPFPSWFFTWPMILIAIGVFSAIRHRFRGIGWLFPIAIGAIFLYDKMSPDVNLRPYFWPILLIAAGLFIIFRPKGHRFRGGRNSDDSDLQTGTPLLTDTQETTPALENTVSSQTEVLDVAAVFGGVKKNVISKNFKGGEIVAVMGGAEINLSQADFKGRIVIECVNVFGGTKLIIPPDWEVHSEMASIFGGVEDKRIPAPNPAPDKIIFLEGTCLFGGLEIKSY